MNVSYKITDSFFDRQAVETWIGKKSAAFLNRAGGFIRTVARRSMRSGGKKGKASEPGQPPRYHSKDKVATLRNILYGYDPGRGSLIVGPVGLNQKQYLNKRLISGTVPQLHEFGGNAGIPEKQLGGQWVPVGRRKPRPGQKTRVKNAKYPKRPFMAPALAKAREKFPTLWYGSVAAA